jgi:hypothetical protein
MAGRRAIRQSPVPRISTAANKSVAEIGWVKKTP